MTLTIGAFSTNTLTAQPFGYDGDARQGLTARRWTVSGLVTKAQWASLLSVYDTWRNTRINDAGSEQSGVTGTTVSFSGTGYNQTWSSIACWFVEAPTAEPAGYYLQATVQLIDAAQALAVLEGERKKNVYVKSITVGAFSTTSLTAQPFGFDGDARKGLTSRKWLVTGLLTTAEWTSLCSVYETWRDSRITDVESFNVNLVGSTVSFAGTGFGQSWSSIACWFSQAPSGTPNGTFVDASFELVDATQAIQVLLREQEKSSYVKSVTIGAFSTTSLTAQPFGYEGEARTGLTARKWIISGLLTTAQWASLCSVYDTWRDLRITDADTLSSGVVGNTVSLTATGFGQSWSGIACWFANPPSASPAGSYLDATVELVDANQALTVLLREQEKSRQASEALIPAFSTITLGTVTVTPLEPPDGYTDTPQPQLSAGGRHYFTGPLGATATRRVRAYVNATDYGTLRTWFETQTATTPASGVWYPVAFPTPSAEVIITGGAKATRYTVEIELVFTR